MFDGEHGYYFDGVSIGDPADWEWLVVGFGRLPSGQVYPAPVVVCEGPDRAGDLMGELDDERPETHLAFPILKVDFRGRNL